MWREDHDILLLLVVESTVYDFLKGSVRELLFFLGLSGQAGPLPINGNKLLGSLGYRSNPQGALLQAEWL